jgi:hypothetical protein
MTDRIMLDLETLGREPGAAVLSISAVRFDADHVGETFARSIDLQSCEAAGLTIDAETLEWWLGQDAAAREVLTGGVPLADALADFAAFYEERCYRTLAALPGAAEIEQDGTAHDALDDATHQAHVAAATLGRLEDGDFE